MDTQTGREDGRELSMALCSTAIAVAGHVRSGLSRAKQCIWKLVPHVGSISDNMRSTP